MKFEAGYVTITLTHEEANDLYNDLEVTRRTGDSGRWNSSMLKKIFDCLATYGIEGDS